jgi:hypothetical protein
MSSFKDPVRKPDDIKTHKSEPISPIEEKKQHNKKQAEEKSKTNHIDEVDNFSMASMMTSLKNTIDNLQKSLSENSSPEPSERKRHLIELKQHLTKLASEAVSFDTSYIAVLSATWNLLINTTLSAAEDRSKKSASNLYFSELCNSIMSYKEVSQHSLGYYLLENAGDKWSPLPLMQMLEHLHQEFHLNPSKSHLNNWITTIDKILLSL